MKDIIIDALVDLYQNGPRDSSLGICWHVCQPLGEEMHGKAVLAMKELFKRWPFRSATSPTTYPVPGPDGLDPVVAFTHADDMWSGEYGEKRWALAEFLLRELCK